MQVTFLDHTGFVELITGETCTILSTVNATAAPETHVATIDGVDVLIFVDAAAGGAAVVQGCYHDYESGGSIHSHARAINAVA
jgi:hypothetical protein